MAIIVTANYNLLPDPTENEGKMAQVVNTIEGYHRGYYVSDGTSWVPAAMRSDAIRAKIEDIEDMVEGIDAPSLTLDDIADGTVNKHFTATEKTKLGTVATGATANASDSALTNRANHSGSQAISTITNLQSSLDGKQAAGSYAPASHTHDDRYNTKTEITDALAGKAAAIHNHDSAYYTKAQVDTALAGKQAAGSYAAASHSHAASDVTGLTAALTKLAGIKFKRAELFSGTTDANGDITVNTSAAFTNPRAFALPAGSADGVGYSMKLISKSGTAITFRAYKTQTTAVLLLNTNVDPDIAAASTAVDILVVEPE